MSGKEAFGPTAEGVWWGIIVGGTIKGTGGTPICGCIAVGGNNWGGGLLLFSSVVGGGGVEINFKGGGGTIVDETYDKENK
jgi:hypothetical protein